MRFELIGAVFNVLNDEQVTTVCARVEGCAGGLELDAATAYVQPRRFEAGIRLRVLVAVQPFASHLGG